MALIDVVSRCVVGWSLVGLDQGGAPKSISSDQGCQFMSHEWAYALSLLQIRISMDGKGQWLDNIPIERFWRTLKVEEVYLNTYKTVLEAREAIGRYIDGYNHKRRHSGSDNHRPIEVMMGLKHPTYWSFKQSIKIKQQQDNITQSLSSSLAA